MMIANVSYGYNDEQIVSTDIIGMSYGSLFDATQTMQKESSGFNGERCIASPIGAGGGDRIMRTVGSPACIAKNRYNLPAEIPLSWQSFLDAYSSNDNQEEKLK